MWVKLVGVLFALELALSQECVHRDYGYGGSVCVCNSSYCDLPPPLPILQEAEFVVYTSSLSGLRFDLSDVKKFDNSCSSAEKFMVDLSVEFQQVEGFGGAFTDSAGILITSLSEDAQAKLLEAYFSKEGISYTLGRVPIAGTDFSTRPYTFAENEIDPELKTFALTDDDFLYKIPFIQTALRLSEGKLRLLAAAWTAPPWMKTNNNYTGVGSLKEEYYEAWSKYQIRFLEEYAFNEISIWMLSTGNEPLNGDIPLFPFNCMGWTPAKQAEWIVQHLGPALRKSGFNTSIITYDDQRFELPAWLKNEFQDEQALEYVSGVGIHWYWDKVAPINFLDKAHDLVPGKFLLATEACYTKKNNQEAVQLGSWERGEGYASSIIDDMNHWVGGWVDWNLALDPAGGPTWADNVVDAAIIINGTSDEFYKQPMFYALGHFSKFVSVGSRRVELTGGQPQLKAIAFVTPEDLLVIVVLNKEDSPENVTISIPSIEKEMKIEMPERSLVTVVAKKPSRRTSSMQ